MFASAIIDAICYDGDIYKDDLCQLPRFVFETCSTEILWKLLTINIRSMHYYDMDLVHQWDYQSNEDRYYYIVYKDEEIDDNNWSTEDYRDFLGGNLSQ